jgi:hypothetical protein
VVVSVFAIAKLRLRNPEKDLGKWEFVSLPKEGDYLAVRVNDEPTVLRVEGVIHSPVMFPAISEAKQKVPTVLVMVSTTADEIAGGLNG